MLNNLLSNAIYAQKQVGGGTITIGVKKDEEVLKIFVRDTGPGISARVRERLFKRNGHQQRYLRHRAGTLYFRCGSQRKIRRNHVDRGQSGRRRCRGRFHSAE